MHDQVRAVLTPEQQKIFDTMAQEGRGQRGPRPGGDDKPADPAPGKP
jgi:Spy/CpxP family protein refolding chaperone